METCGLPKKYAKTGLRKIRQIPSRTKSKNTVFQLRISIMLVKQHLSKTEINYGEIDDQHTVLYWYLAILIIRNNDDYEKIWPSKEHSYN